MASKVLLALLAIALLGIAHLCSALLDFAQLDFAGLCRALLGLTLDPGGARAPLVIINVCNCTQICMYYLVISANLHKRLKDIKPVKLP